MKKLTTNNIKAIVDFIFNRLAFYGGFERKSRYQILNSLSYLIGKMQGQKIYSQITLQKGERSELAELASDLL